MLGVANVCCPHNAEGCQWTGAQVQLQAHIAQCPFEAMRLYIAEQALEIQELRTQLQQMQVAMAALLPQSAIPHMGLCAHSNAVVALALSPDAALVAVVFPSRVVVLATDSLRRLCEIVPPAPLGMNDTSTSTTSGTSGMTEGGNNDDDTATGATTTTTTTTTTSEAPSILQKDPLYRHAMCRWGGGTFIDNTTFAAWTQLGIGCVYGLSAAGDAAPVPLFPHRRRQQQHRRLHCGWGLLLCGLRHSCSSARSRLRSRRGTAARWHSRASSSLAGARTRSDGACASRTATRSRSTSSRATAAAPRRTTPAAAAAAAPAVRPWTWRAACALCAVRGTRAAWRWP